MTRAEARRPATIRDVAARAGVHPATASRALNPALPGRVTQETTRKVALAARELDYTPDPTARSLRTRRSGFVGVVIPDLTNPVLPPIVRGVEETLWQSWARLPARRHRQRRRTGGRTRREAARPPELAPAEEPIVVHGEAFTIPAGRQATEELLRAPVGVTAIVSGNDMIALGCYEALAAAGLRCPEDVSVVGHNDMPLVARVQPPLTTVAIPQHAIGVEAARTLLALLRGEPLGRDRRLLGTRLVVRGSTCPPSGSFSTGSVTER